MLLFADPVGRDKVSQSFANTAWILACTAGVLFMQAGFCCLESGLVRAKNSINVAMKNLADIGLSVLLFWLIGYAIMFGSDWAGILGTDGFASENLSSYNTAFLLFQATFCGTAATIVSGAVAERMKFSGYILLVVLCAVLVYPFAGHWIWGSSISGQPGWLESLGFVDFAGSTVVHSLGGWLALAAVLVVGPRDGRFESGREFRASNMPLAALGVFILWTGWLAFNGGSMFMISEDLPKIFLNTVVAGAGGGVCAAFYVWVATDVPDARACMNGILAGLVSVTAGCSYLSTSFALVVGCIGGLIAILGKKLLERRKIDDALSVIPVHSFAGVWGTVAVGMFGDLELISTGLSRLQQVGIQFLGALVVAVWSFGSGYMVLRSVSRWFSLRVTQKEEKLGLNLVEHDETTDALELIREMEVHRLTPNAHHQVTVVPFSDVELIASQYNRVLDRLDLEREKQQLSQVELRTVIDTSPFAFVNINAAGEIVRWNASAHQFFGWREDEMTGKQFVSSIVTTPDRNRVRALVLSGRAEETEFQALRRDGTEFPARLLVSHTKVNNTDIVNIAMQDLSDARELQAEKERMQARLHQAEKLESIGKLAAGIAHEINTPSQYIGNNVTFLKKAFSKIMNVVPVAKDLIQCAEDGTGLDEATIKKSRKALRGAKLDFLEKEVPRAIDQSLEGLSRVSSIVSAMKSFSHPSGGTKELVNLKELAEVTLTVARGEWKHVADATVECDGDLPAVPVLRDEMGQVLLNIVVNAAHAVGDRVEKGELEKGKIGIAIRMSEPNVELRVSDTGGGIPEDIRSKIFDPFFTTKEVGKGTGQGLAIAHSTVVDKHGGSIEVEINKNEGTTFVISLPMREQVESQLQGVH